MYVFHSRGKEVEQLFQLDTTNRYFDTIHDLLKNRKLNKAGVLGIVYLDPLIEWNIISFDKLFDNF